MTDPGRKTVRCLVAGRVQGVWYRATVREQAIQLELDGWARNLTDGRVEVVVSGRDAAVEALCGLLWTGSPAARVDSVDVEAVEIEVSPGFEIR